MMARINISGNTFPVKDKLKALGCKWDGTAKVWFATDELMAAQAKEIVGNRTCSDHYTANTSVTDRDRAQHSRDEIAEMEQAAKEEAAEWRAREAAEEAAVQNLIVKLRAAGAQDKAIAHIITNAHRLDELNLNFSSPEKQAQVMQALAEYEKESEAAMNLSL